MQRIALPLALVGVLAGAPALAAPSPQLSKLGVSTGKWVFHGKALKSQYGKAGSWTWHEDCRWSSNRLFLECTFDNTWSGKTVRSLVVDTYNTEDHSYWHYEFFAEGAGGAHPFVSRMAVHGNTWIEYGHEKQNGKRLRERIVYHFLSAKKVKVRIEISRNGHDWTTVDRGEGTKQ